MNDLTGHMKVCVPESLIECVSVDDRGYYVLYFSGRHRIFKEPPASVRYLMAHTPTKEHITCKYGKDTWESDVYRNYKIIWEE